MLTLTSLSKECPTSATRTPRNLTISMWTLNVSRCNTSREVHDKRHREIAALVQAIQKIDSVHKSMLGPIANRQTRLPHGYDPKRFQDHVGMTEEFEFEDDWVESSNQLNDDDTTSAGLTSDTAKEKVGSKKAQRAERKIAKNQARFDIITTENVKRVDAALHPYQPTTSGIFGRALDPLDNQTIEANITFHSGTFKFGSLRQDVHTKKLLKNNGPHKADEGDNQLKEAINFSIILHRLGINHSVLPNTKERKSLLTKLHEAITYDLECVANEERDTMMRMAGYWRYANRRTYNVMVRNNQLWDWTTGAKLEEVEEEDEEDDISSIDERFSELSTAATTPTIRHFSPDIDDWSEDFDLAAGKALCTSGAGDTEAINEGTTPSKSTFTGQADTRHLQNPNRVVAASRKVVPAATPLPSPQTVTPWARLPTLHRDTNNRFSPLSAIAEEPAAPVRPIAAITIIARNRSPSRRVVFPSLRGSAAPPSGRRQQRGGPRGGLPVRGSGKAANAKGLSYASMLRRGL